MLTRREMIKRGFWAPAILAAAKGVAAQDGEAVVLEPSPAIVPFTRRLKIPRPHLALNRPGATPQELAKAQSIFQQAQAEDRFKHEAVPPSGACDYYEVVMKEGLQEIIPGMLTRIWGYNGVFPGPTFIAERDRPKVVRFVNRLDDIVSIHYHGGHTPPDSDGVPMESFSRFDVISPAFPYPGARTNVYPNDNPFPATQWYHDHGEDVTAETVYMGLAGLYFLRDSVESSLNLPTGEFEIPLVIQDRRFNADGSFRYPAASR